MIVWCQSSGIWEVWRERFKNASECRDYVGTQGFEAFGKEPIKAGSLIGVEVFEGSLGF